MTDYLGEDFAAFYRSNFAGVAGALRAAGAGREQADDLAQEAFVRTLARWPRVQQGINPVGYVYRTAMRLRWRAARPLRDQPSPIASPDPGDSMLAVDVQRVLASMPRRQRACATLRYISDLSTLDIAAVLGIAESTVRVHLHRARAELVAVLEPFPEASHLS